MAVFQLLLESGASVKKLDRSQQSALHKAAQFAGCAECVKLIDAGSDVIALDCRGYSPLHVAAARKCVRSLYCCV